MSSFTSCDFSYLIEFVIERAVAARLGLERVEEVVNDLIERHIVVQAARASRVIYSICSIVPRLLLAQLHYAADIIVRYHDVQP